MNQYPIYEVTPQQRILEQEDEKESAGYQDKFWVDQPVLGRSLVKFEEETAPAWSEKAAYEIAKLLGLPAARYELGKYDNNRPVVISPDFKDPSLNYIDASVFNAQQLMNLLMTSRIP